MDILKARRLFGASIVSAMLLGVVLTSCLGVLGGRPSFPTFPHDVHVGDKGLACTFCHVTVMTADMPSMPPPELCAPCHADIDKDKPQERRIAAFYEPGGRYRQAAPMQLHEDVRYAHRDHAGAARLACADCHRDIAQLDYIPLTTDDWKPVCMDCHERSGKDNGNCSGCHDKIDRDWQPASHFLAWDTRHGDVVRAGGTGSANRCDLCHDQTSSCQACHESTPPRDHNNFFRIRGHGVIAGMDRSRCDTCHQSDTCTQCHADTRPLSHRAGFGAPGNSHCNGCHFPVGDNGCAVCHRETPSHTMAAPLPPTHTPAMNCRLCHGNGQALPHPDGGHACTICHH